MTGGASPVYRFGPFVLDVADRSLKRQGVAIPLTPKQFDLLVALLASAGRLVDKDALLKSVWPDVAVEEGNLTKGIFSGYLRNQRLVDSVDDVDSITVDWDVDAAAVKTLAGIERFDEKTAKRVVTTGCGQGTVFGHLMSDLESVELPPASDPSARIGQATLYGLLNAIRLKESTYKSAGSVHGCALFRQQELLTFVEDVGRHNAIDTIAGWMWLHGVAGGDKIFYTTGRLTSEMVIKSAQMGIPVIVSRSGATQMGYELAQRLGLTLFGRAMNRHFICYSGFDRFDAEPEPPRPT